MDAVSTYRLFFFIGVLFLMMLWELTLPKRALTIGRSRWIGNLGIAALNGLTGRLIAPFVPVTAAVFADQHGWGIMNVIPVPVWAAIIIGITVLDMVIYLQHVMFHAVPSLWRLHMMHHADHDIDVTTGLRFHPIEIIISLGIKLAVVVLLGVPVQGVLAFEIILNGMAMFNHGNVRIPFMVDRILRKVIVTPDMHRVHHSVNINETNSNFGFNLSCWDYIFGTYQDQPSAGHDTMVIGASHLREMKWQNIIWMLVLPFVVKPGPYPLGRHGRKTGKQ
jgi:sterol desaturase/sphingolipid hydroxylase (fatty acid hydroxylase superfamily)